MYLQVTFNYCYVRYDEEARDCLCGHPNCIKVLGTKRGEDGDNVGGVSGGTGNRGGASGGGSGGDKSHGKGRCRKKTAPKWQDPETGEHLRPWLHSDDAEVRNRVPFCFYLKKRVWRGLKHVLALKSLYLPGYL